MELLLLLTYLCKSRSLPCFLRLENIPHILSPVVHDLFFYAEKQKQSLGVLDLLSNNISTKAELLP